MHNLKYKHWYAHYHLNTVLYKAALIWLLYELFIRILITQYIHHLKIWLLQLTVAQEVERVVQSLEGRWFDFPDCNVKVSLSKTLNHKLHLMSWSVPCMAASSISV